MANNLKLLQTYYEVGESTVKIGKLKLRNLSIAYILYRFQLFFIVASGN